MHRHKQNKASQLQHTNIQATVLHLLPVFQVHGPDMTVKQAGRVGDGVLSCAENNEYGESSLKF